MAGDPIDPGDLLLLQAAAGAGCAITAEMDRLDAAAWSALAQQAIRFRLGPMLASLIARHGWRAPAETCALLERDRRENTLRALSQRRTLASLASRMNQLGMKHVALKGGALVLSERPDQPVWRVMRDLDILLAPEDAARIHLDLLACGWTVPPGFIRDADPDGHHLPVIADPANDNLVELHFRLSRAHWAGEPALRERLLRNAIAVSCLGQQVRAADPLSNFLHLLAHATINRPFDPGPQFLADVSGLIGSGKVDPAALKAQADELGLGRALGLTIGLMDHLNAVRDETWRSLAAPVPAPLLDAAMHVLLAPQDRVRDLRFREDFAGSKSTAVWLLKSLTRAFSPRAEALAAIAGREPGDPLRYLAYPRWIAQRISAMARATFDPGIGLGMDKADALRDWLSIRSEKGNR